MVITRQIKKKKGTHNLPLQQPSIETIPTTRGTTLRRGLGSQFQFAFTNNFDVSKLWQIIVLQYFTQYPHFSRISTLYT